MNTESESPLFGTVERRFLRTTSMLFCVVALLALLGFAVWVLGQLVTLFYNLLLPLAIAGVFALVLYPVVDFLEDRVGMPRVAAVGLILLIFTLAVVATVFLLLPAVAQQLLEFSKTVPEIVRGWQDHLTHRFPGLNAMLVSHIEDGGLDGILPEFSNTGKTIKSSLGVLAGLAFVPLFLFFTLLSGEHMRGQAAELLSIFSASIQERVLYFMDVFVGQITTFFQGQLIIALAMGVMYAIGFTLIGLKVGILLGLFLGLLNIVPFLGTLIGLILVLPLAYFQPGGGVSLLGLCIAVFALVQLIESWLLTPKIMADRSGLHPALVVVAIFFWGTALDGILGMILAVPLTAFIIAVWGQVKAGLTRSMSPHGEGPEVEIKIDRGTGSEAEIRRDLEPAVGSERKRSAAKGPDGNYPVDTEGVQG